LNHYFGAQAVRLPYAYGGNLAIKERSPEMWEAMQKDMRIIHYTLGKPFDPKIKCPGGICNPDTVFDLGIYIVRAPEMTRLNETYFQHDASLIDGWGNFCLSSGSCNQPTSTGGPTMKIL